MVLNALMVWLGCTGEDVAGDYAARKAEMLADPPALDGDWKPDATVRLSEPLVQDLLTQGIEREVDAMGAIDVKVGKLRPKLEVESIELSEGSCATCVVVDAGIVGEAALRVGGTKYTLPYTGSFEVEVAFSTSAEADGRHVVMSVKEVTRFSALLGKSQFDVSGPLERWGGEVLGRVDPLDLGAYGGEDLGLRDIRIEPESGGLRVQMATVANPGGNVARLPDPPSEGFEAVVSPRSLLSLAQVAAYEHGEIEHGLYAEPTSLTILPSSFELGVRLSHLEGGWWREYTVIGTFSVSGGWLDMKATSIEPGESSSGAAALDVLAVLTEWFVLDLVRDAAQASIPTRERATAGSLGVNAELTEVLGSGGKLVLRGKATVGPAGKKSVR